MWNDTDVPLAYLVTFRTYSTWLHGDERGSISRHKNAYRSSRLQYEPNWLEINSERMKRDPVLLDGKQRKVVKEAIQETCSLRKWTLFAINVRTNHVHAVIAGPSATAGKVLNAVKANSTRSMRESMVWTSDYTPWVDKGSTRYLWNNDHVMSACAYVEYGQGEDLPEFD
jgi:REP element-mobilizing transposase RayT